MNKEEVNSIIKKITKSCSNGINDETTIELLRKISERLDTLKNIDNNLLKLIKITFGEENIFHRNQFDYIHKHNINEGLFIFFRKADCIIYVEHTEYKRLVLKNKKILKYQTSMYEVIIDKSPVKLIFSFFKIKDIDLNMIKYIRGEIIKYIKKCGAIITDRDIIDITKAETIYFIIKNISVRDIYDCHVITRNFLCYIEKYTSYIEIDINVVPVKDLTNCNIHDLLISDISDGHMDYIISYTQNCKLLDTYYHCSFGKEEEEGLSILEMKYLESLDDKIASEGEKKCLKILSQEFPNNTFSKCRPKWLVNDMTGFNMEIDLYCEDLGLGIEYNGRQHYKECNNFKNFESVAKQIQRDMKKQKLFIKNGKTLIVIPFYSDIKKVLTYEICKFKIYQNNKLKCVKQLHPKSMKTTKPESLANLKYKHLKDFENCIEKIIAEKPKWYSTSKYVRKNYIYKKCTSVMTTKCTPTSFWSIAKDKIIVSEKRIQKNNKRHGYVKLKELW